MILADKDYFGDVTVFFFAMISPKLELVYWHDWPPKKKLQWVQDPRVFVP